MASVKIGDKLVGDARPAFVVAEIGINHNGSLDLAKRLIDGALLAGCDAVKFQKRSPTHCVPKEQWHIERDTPWGRMTYIDYRHRIEFGEREYAEIDRYCKERKILWFASCWDEASVDFMERFDPPCYKAASASLTDHDLLLAMKRTHKPLMISTGMSTWEEIETAIAICGEENLLVAHSTSMYPCQLEDINLKMINTLKAAYPNVPIGYSGHEVGLAPTWAAVALGATFVERHVTLDRAMWGTDQAASVEIVGLVKLVANLRDIEKSMGDGVKKVHEKELAQRKKLRRVASENGAAALQKPSTAVL
jgi:N-acetylneuraminate synthase